MGSAYCVARVSRMIDTSETVENLGTVIIGHKQVPDVVLANILFQEMFECLINYRSNTKYQHVFNFNMCS